MADPSPKDLFKKLVGKPILLTTGCGTFVQANGTFKDVFDDFLLFLTRDDRLMDAPPTRNWILMTNVAIVTETPTIATEEGIEIER